MSTPIASPNSPYLAACGLAVCSGAHRGFNAGGRVTYYHISGEDDSIAIEYESQAISTSNQDSVTYCFYQGDFFDRGEAEGTFYLPYYEDGERPYIEVVTLPSDAAWQSFTGFKMYYNTDLVLTWDGDADTEEFQVSHALLANKSDSRLVEIVSSKDSVTTTDDLGNAQDYIEVTGVDGYHGSEGNYTVTLTKDEVTEEIAVEIEDDADPGTPIFSDTWNGFPMPCSRGISISVNEDAFGVGETTKVLKIKTEIDRRFVLHTPVDGTHYFQIKAVRDDNNEATSAWTSYAHDAPPGHVTDVDFAFTAIDDIDLTFTMPADADIAGWRLYVSRDWDTDFSIPHWIPFATDTAAPSADVTYNLTTLQAGYKYGFNIRAYDSSGKDDESIDIYYLEVETTGVVEPEMLPPNWINAEVVQSGSWNIVYIHVETPDSNEDGIIIYNDSGTGTIDYNSGHAIPIDDLSFGRVDGKYTYTQVGLSGDVLVAARCYFGDIDGDYVVEKNTHIVDSIYVYPSTLTAPSNLTVEVAYHGI